MGDEKESSLVDVTGLSKPADTLIKKVSGAVGGIFEPWQIKRVAKAEAEAKMIAAKADIEVTDLHRRATHRWFEEEARRQQNMEAITMKAASQLEPGADAANMEDDWITNFFDKSRIVSDEEMQTLWASVLAGEANQPGSFSKRTVNYLGDLDKRDAEAFVALCRFGWVIGEFTPLIFDVQKPIYKDHGINFVTLTHLESIGLAKFNNLAGFQRLGLPKTFTVAYGDSPLVLEFAKEQDNELEIGHVLLTQAGKELARVCTATKVPGFDAYVREQWKKYLPAPAAAEQGAPAGSPAASG